MVLILKNFVISLSSALERRHHIAQVFNEQGIDFEFFDAITPEKAYDLKEKYFPECCSDNISAADLACAMSHIAVWLRAKELGLKYVAIFEDDVYLGENATLFLNSSNWIPKNIDVIKLETFLTKIFLGDSAGNIHNRSLYQLKHFHFGGAGYILSLKAIDCLLAEIKMKKNILPIDWVLFHDPIYDNCIKVYQLSPALCIQDKVKNKEITFESSLEEGRIQFESPKVKLKFLNKIKREIFRLINQVRALIFSRVVDFK